MKELNEETKFQVSVKTLIAIAVGIFTLVGFWFALQEDINEAKELPKPEVSRTEYDLKDQLIRETILNTDYMKLTLQKRRDEICSAFNDILL